MTGTRRKLSFACAVLVIAAFALPSAPAAASTRPSFHGQISYEKPPCEGDLTSAPVPLPHVLVTFPGTDLHDVRTASSGKFTVAIPSGYHMAQVTPVLVFDGPAIQVAPAGDTGNGDPSDA